VKDAYTENPKMLISVWVPLEIKKELVALSQGDTRHPYPPTSAPRSTPG